MKRCVDFHSPAALLIHHESSLKKARSNQQISVQPNDAAAYSPNSLPFVTKKDKAIACFWRELLSYAEDVEASENLKLALKAKDYIRDTLYNKHKGSFKSSNKISLTNDWIDEITRITRANHEIFIWSNGFDKARNHILTAKGHNCDELALAAHDWLARTKSADVCMLQMTGHTATVVGKLPDHALPKDMTEWPSHLSICDPWLNVACLAKDYPARFKEKMQKWENDDKLIKVDGNWLSPLDPAWIKLIDDKKILWHPDNFIDPNIKEPPRECN